MIEQTSKPPARSFAESGAWNTPTCLWVIHQNGRDNRFWTVLIQPIGSCFFLAHTLTPSWIGCMRDKLPLGSTREKYVLESSPKLPMFPFPWAIAPQVGLLQMLRTFGPAQRTHGRAKSGSNRSQQCGAAYHGWGKLEAQFSFLVMLFPSPT